MLQVTSYKLQVTGPKGFTLIETLVVVALVALLASAVVFSTISFRSQIDLNTTAQNVLNTLRVARAKTLSSEGASQYGVHFESGKYVLFKGASYNPGALDNESYFMPANFEIANIALVGGSEVIFQRLTGQTSNSGSIQVRQISDPTKSKTVMIESSGEVSFSGTVQPPAGGYLTDTRHVHITYDHPLVDERNAVTLTLAFPGFPLSTTAILFQNYLNADKTKFSWEGTVAVNGQNQVLKIHTHVLSASGAQFSLHRDRAQNTEALDILLDGITVISYAANGSVTAGPLYTSNLQIQ